MIGIRPLIFATVILASCLVNQVAAHGNEASHGAMMNQTSTMKWSQSFDHPNYYHHEEYRFWIYMHIFSMFLSWVIILPIATMFSIAKSRYTTAIQFAFVLMNGAGLISGCVYNVRTPDLYENNAHHKIGWVCSSLAATWFFTGIINTYAGKIKTKPLFGFRRQSYQKLNQEERRWSGDSGVGTAVASSPDTERSLPSFSGELPALEKQDDEDEAADGRLLRNTRLDKFLVRHIQKHAIGTPLMILRIIYNTLDRTLILLAFTAFLTGFVTFAGIFRGSEVFTGLAHFIKGGIFFWIGLLVIGRWAGAFADLGWAWNAKPPAEAVGRTKAATPSFEFFESFLIALYGISNVWLEHLSSETWSPMDYEHISITILFMGGGILGLLIESQCIRKLLNMSVIITQPPETHFSPANTTPSISHPTWSPPPTAPTPMNPIPALTILLLGIIMSAHIQHSQLASTLHTYWGALFVFGAMARIFTYVLHYLSPPVSYYPSRPPTELVAGFALTAGGLLFMLSARDITDILEGAGGDAMVMFVVGMGFTAIMCAATVGSLAIKGWATRMEHTKALTDLRAQGVSV